MKKKLFKSMIFMTLLLSICLALSMSVSAKTVVTGDFKFDVKTSAATLIEYTGKSTSVTIPSEVNSVKVTAIGNEAFWKNETMTSISIPSTVTSIGDAAFNECTALKKVVIPSKVTSIGEAAFWYCSSLKSVVIPKSVTKIGNNAFKGCTALTAYTVKGSFGETYIKNHDYIKLAYRYATSLKLSASSLTVSMGSTKSLTATLSPSPVYIDGVTYKSSNTKVAKVSASGAITPVAPGSAVITVTAKDGSKISAKCNITVTPAQVKNVKAGTLTLTSAAISWGKTAGAASYQVYKYNTSTKKWVKLTNTSKTTYTDKTAKTGETPIYKIRAYAKASDSKYYYGSYSAALKITMPAPGLVSDLKAAATTDYLNLTWGKAANATGYRVFQYNPATKKYVTLANTNALKYTVKKLTPNTEYTFAVRAFYKDSAGKVTWAAKYETVKIATRPEQIKTLALEKGGESFDRISVKWTALKNVTGYQISYTPKGGTATVKTLTGADTANYTIEGLSYGTEYSIKIRAYTKRTTSPTAYSYYSSAITASTLALPSNAEEAFTSFISAYNNTKLSDKNSVLYKQTQVINFSGESSDKYEHILSALTSQGTEIYVFEKGKDKNGNTPSAYLAPVGTGTALTSAQLAANSLSYKGNGSGYEITFALPYDNTGDINSLIAGTVDFSKASDAADNFALTSCDYTGTTVTAKVQNGLISHMEITQPVTVSFKLGIRSYSFTQTIVTTYAFIEY